MPRKKKRSLIEELFRGSFFKEINDVFTRLDKETLQGGYSISVTQTPEGVRVYAKVGKDVNVNELRRKLQQEYPGAEIEIDGGEPLIREISTKSLKEKRENKGDEGLRIRVE